MAINKKFIRFKNYENYITARDNGQILPKSIVFVAEAKTIYLNEEEFSANTLYNLKELLENINDFELQSTDTPNQAIVKIYKSVDSHDEIIKTIVLSVSDLEEALTKEIADVAEITAAGLSDLNRLVEYLRENNKGTILQDNQLIYYTSDNNKLNIVDWAQGSTPGGSDWAYNPTPHIVSHEYNADARYGIITFDTNTIPNGLFISQPTLLKVDMADNIIYIGAEAFCDCINLKEIRLSNTLKAIGYAAFYEDSGLESIYIPDSVVTMHQNPDESDTFHHGNQFMNCESLDKIRLSKNMTEIPAACFWNCYSLSSIYLPNSIEKINGNAFTACRNVNNIVLGSNVKTIGENVFSDCISIKSFKILSTKLTSFNNNMFVRAWIDTFEMPSSITECSATFLNVSIINHLIFPATFTHFTRGHNASATIRNIDFSGDSVTNFPRLNNKLETVILRKNALVTGLDELIPSSIITTKLQIYVPTDLIKSYETTYPNLSNYFFEITGDSLATKKYVMNNIITKIGVANGIATLNESGKVPTEQLPNLEDMLAYGVEWDVTVLDPHITRIGNMSLHKTLPIQSLLKGCIALGNKIMYYLNDIDWRFRQEPLMISGHFENGNSSKFIPDSNLGFDLLGSKLYVRAGEAIGYIEEYQPGEQSYLNNIVWSEGYPIDIENITEIELGSRLDGYDGTVRIHCPAFYIKSESDGNKRRVRVSTVKIDNTWTLQPEILIDAYKSTVLTTVPSNMGYLSTLTEGSAVSIENNNEYCLGGDLLPEVEKIKGKPRTGMSRSEMRDSARLSNSELLSYTQYKNIFYWLYVIEYANFDCQEEFTSQLTLEGYCQGGLGAGVTEFTQDLWFGYLDGSPATKCGWGNNLGNYTGVCDDTVEIYDYTEECHVPRWHGFENPFGDIHMALDGIVVEEAESSYNVYTTDTPSEFTDTIDDKKLIGSLIKANGYIEEFNIGSSADIIPISTDSEMTLKCDYFNGTTQSSGTILYMVVGGFASDGYKAGLGCISFYPSTIASYIGFRTVSLI